MIVDAYLNVQHWEIPFCVGKDRVGKVYKPIYFQEKWVPEVGTRFYIERHGLGWRIKGRIITRGDLDGLEIGDRMIAAGRNLILDAENSIEVEQDVSMNDNKISDLAIPTEDHDAANKEYVDAIAPIAAPHASSHVTGGLDILHYKDMDIVAVSAPATPSSDHGSLYFTASGTTPNREVALKFKNEAGIEFILASWLV